MAETEGKSPKGKRRQGQPVRGKRKWLKRIGYGLAGLIVLIIAAAAGALGWLGSESGRAWVSQKANAELGAFGVRISGLGWEGLIPRSLHLDQVTVDDATGTWLSVADINIDLSPMALLDREVSIDRASIAGIDMPRLPVPAETPEQLDEDAPPPDLVPPDLTHLPDTLPVDIKLGSLAIDRIVLANREAEALALSATLRANRSLDLINGDITLKGAGQDVTRILSVTGDWVAARDVPLDLTTNIAIREGGRVNTLISELVGREVRFGLSAEGKTAAGGLPLTLKVTDSQHGQATANFVLSAAPGLAGTVQLNPDPAMWGQPITLKTDVQWRGGRKDWPFEMTIASAGSTVTAAGRLAADGQVGAQISGRIPSLPIPGDQDLLSWESGAIDMTASANLWTQDARLRGDINLGRVAYDAISVDTANANLDLVVEQQAPLGRAVITWQGLSGLPEAAGDLPPDGRAEMALTPGSPHKAELQLVIGAGDYSSPPLSALAIVEADPADLMTPTYSATLQAAGLAAAGFGVDSATITAKGSADLASGKTTGAVTATWDALSGLPAEIGALARSGSLAGDFAAGGNGLSVTRTSIDATGVKLDDIAVTLSGNGALTKATLGLQSLDLAQLELPNQPLSGTASGRVDLSGQPLAGPIALSVANLSGLADPVGPLLGSKPQLSARLAWDGGQDIALSDLDLKAAQISASGRIAMPPRADLVVRLDRLSTFSPRIAGAMKATIVGQPDDLKASITLPDLRIDGQPVEDARINIAANLAGEVPSANLDGKLGDDITMKANLAPIGTQGLRIAPLNIKVGPNSLAGQLQVQMDSQLAEGDITLNAPDLTDLHARLPILPYMAGVAKGKVTLAPSSGQQSIRANAEIIGLQIDASTIAQASLDASISNALGQNPAITGRLTATKAEYANLARLGKLEASVDGGLDRLGFKLDATDGQIRAIPLNAQIAGQVRQGEQLVLLDIAKGNLGALDFALNQQARLSPDRATFSMGLDEGQINLDMRQTQGRRDLDFTAKDIRLRPFGAMTQDALQLNGALDLTANISGPINQPRGQITLAARDISLGAQSAGQGLESIKLTANVQPRMIAITGDGVASGTVSPDDAGTDAQTLRQPFTMSARLPVSFDNNGIPAPDDGRQLEGRLDASLALAPFNPILEDLGHRMEGQLDIDVSAAGTFAKPRINGTISPLDLGYQNINVGTVLRDVGGTINITPEQITVTDLKARTGGEGRLAVGGSLRNWMGGRPDNDIKITMDNARLSDSELLRLDLSGTVAALGAGQTLALTGDLEVKDARINIPRRLPVSIPELDVSERVADPDSEDAYEEATPDALNPSIDVKIRAPGRVYLQGRGINAELEGILTATGTLADPRLLGPITVRRGTMDLLGRQWNLAGGSIQFSGRTDEATLNLRATASREGVTAIALITGRLTAPEVTLTSEPELPQDEILSYILFGKDSTSLSAGEAVSLASSVAQLSGMAGGASPLDELRDATGLDRFGFGGEEGGLEAGKYLTDRIYIGVEQGLSENASKARIDFEITDELKLEGSVGTLQGGKAGFKWEREY